MKVGDSILVQAGAIMFDESYGKLVRHGNLLEVYRVINIEEEGNNVEIRDSSDNRYRVWKEDCYKCYNS